MVVVPLLVRETVVGVITLIATKFDHRYTEAALSTARDLAAHAALAIDNARLYERAQEAIRGREDILSFVSHDLRNPLMGIELTTETILRSPPQGEERRKGWRQIERIRRGVQHMRRMTEDLLDMGSLDAGQLALSFAPHDVKGLFSDAAHMLAPLAAEKHLTLRFDVDGDGLFVRCDRDPVLRVLSNLIGNAIKFTPANGTITVTGRHLNKQALLSVTDEGPGILPSLRPHIFDRFWQGDGDAPKGRGLGLFIAKGLVEAHGGTLSVEGAEGTGATFSFTLPLASASVDEPHRDAVPPPVAPPEW
jgi:signal transduction histidine kinase